MSTLNLFPARIEIGQFVDAKGNPVKVYPSPEFVRALADLFERVGGSTGADMASLTLLAGYNTVPAPVEPLQDEPSSDAGSQIVGLRLELENAMAQAQAANAQLADALSRLDALEAQMQPIQSPYVDWESPGKIGNKRPNTGAFTTLKTGTTGTAGLLEIARSSDGSAVTTMTMNANNLEIDNSAGDVIIERGSVERIRATATGMTVAGSATATGTIKSGATGTAGMLQICRASDGLATGTDTMVVNVREIDNSAGDIVLKRGSVERIRATATGMTVSGTAAITGNCGVTGAFGCNAAAVSGKVTVTGSRGGNAALASFLTAMATFGFITDSTTA